MWYNDTVVIKEGVVVAKGYDPIRVANTSASREFFYKVEDDVDMSFQNSTIYQQVKKNKSVYKRLHIDDNNYALIGALVTGALACIILGVCVKVAYDKFYRFEKVVKMEKEAQAAEAKEGKNAMRLDTTNIELN